MIDLSVLKSLSDAKGISSCEETVCGIIEEKMKGLVDDVRHDGLGSVIGTKCYDNKGPKIMIATHADEVGFFVRDIDENGFLKLTPVGSWWSHMLLGHNFTVVTQQGKEIKGFIGSMATHGLPQEIRSKTVDINDVYLDLGVASRQEALDLGIQIGDMVAPDTELRRMNNPKYIAGKALDNRVSCAVGLYILERLKNKSHAPLSFAATAQEEPGLRGARTATDVNASRFGVCDRYDSCWRYANEQKLQPFRWWGCSLND